MEMKYDSYYEKELPYKMSMEELMEESTREDGSVYFTQQDILAYIRERGADNVVFMMPTTLPNDMMLTPFGFGLSSGRNGNARCKIVPVDDPMYNPLVERDAIRENHWYHAYKIKLTPIEYNGFVDSWYVSDFVSAINEGRIQIWEEEAV